LFVNKAFYSSLPDILREPMLRKAPRGSVAAAAAAHKTKSLLLLHFILLSC